MSSIFPFDVTDLPIFNRLLVVAINFIVFALLIAVLKHNKYRDKQSQIFGAMGIFMLLWVDFAYLARLFGDNNLRLSEVFLRIAWVATPLLFYCTYLVSIFVIKKEKNYKWIILGLLFVALGISIATAFTNLIIKGITFTGINLDIVYGVGFYPFLLIIIAFMVATLTPLIRVKLDKSARGFLIGVLVFYSANAIFNIALPVFFNITHLYYIGDYSTVFLLSLTAYSIVQHELFDIKIIATEALTVTIWIILLSKLFVTQSITGAAIDTLILGLMLIFGILLIRSVIREVKQREKLQELTQKLKELDAQKDEFISMAAHELRAPMTAIKGYLSMILEGDTGEIPEKTRGYLADATAINDRLVRLVNNMLNVSRIEEGRMVYQLEVESLSNVARTAYATFRPEAERKGLEFKLEIPKEIKDRVEVDPDRIHEVLANLLSNSIKYTEHGSIRLKLSQPTPTTIRSEVVDTGFGISKEEQQKLFNKFYRAESTVGKTTGTGLGLYICKLLVEKFKGRLGVNSEVGKGSTFWFELPLAQTKPKED